MRLSEFGKEMRKHRIDQGVRLNVLAKQLGVSSSFLSAVETGAKKPSIALVDQVGAAMSLNADQIRRLHALADQERKNVTVDLDSASQKSRALATAFARKFDSLTDEQVRKMFQALGDDG